MNYKKKKKVKLDSTSNTVIINNRNGTEERVTLNKDNMHYLEQI